MSIDDSNNEGAITGDDSTDKAVRREVALQSLGHVFWAPITWVPFVPAMGLVALVPMPWWGEAATLLAPAAFVAYSWSAYWPRLTNLLTAQALHDRTLTSQKHFTELVRNLTANHMEREAEIMMQAHNIVTQIAGLNATQGSDQSLRIEALARRVLVQMQADAQASLKGARSDGHAERLEASLQTLHESYRTVQKQVQLLNKLATPQTVDRLGELRDQLKNENTIAENVTNRLESDTQNL